MIGYGRNAWASEATATTATTPTTVLAITGRATPTAVIALLATIGTISSTTAGIVLAMRIVLPRGWHILHWRIDVVPRPRAHFGLMSATMGPWGILELRLRAAGPRGLLRGRSRRQVIPLRAVRAPAGNRRTPRGRIVKTVGHIGR